MRRLGVVLTALLALLLAFFWWVQSEGSLASGLRWAGPWLPAGQTLEAAEVTGSLAHGGHIGHLEWREGGTRVSADALALEWDWRALLDGEWHLTHLQARQVRIHTLEDSRPGPWPELVLSLRLDAQVAVETLQWDGPPAWRAHQLQGRYVFDGRAHRIDAGRLTLADGSYQFSGQVQARGAMALQAQVSGVVQAALPGTRGSVSAQAEARVQGQLGGPDALLELVAQLQPRQPSAATRTPAMQASVQARLAPARAQMLEQVQARWSALDLAVLWPQAPHTRLSGQFEVQPVADGWRASGTLQNAAAGTLDQQRLPLESLQVRLDHVQGHWQVSELQARGAGGSVQAQGAWAGTPHRWNGQAQVQGLQLQRLDARWAAAVLDGTLSARQQDQGGWTFSLQGGAQVGRQGQATQIRTLAADGAWNAAVLQIDHLLVQSQDAELRGQWTLDTRSYGGHGQLQLQLPGGELRLEGALEQTRGQGSLRLQVRDGVRWMQSLQAWMPPAWQLPSVPADSALDLRAAWQGGWDHLSVQTQAQAQAASRTWHWDADADAALGEAQARIDLTRLQLGAGDWQAVLGSPVQLRWRAAADAHVWQVDAGSLQLRGPVPGTVQLDWQAAQGSTRPGGTWHSQGRWSGLPQGWLEQLSALPLATLGLQGDLVFGGQWDVTGGASTQLVLVLERSAGDLQLQAQDASLEARSAGLRQARLWLELQGEALRARFDWASAAAGTAHVDFSTRVQSEAGGRWRWPADAPVQASMQAQLPRVGVWSVLAPPGWRLQGSLDADLDLNGTRAAPQWKGTVLARDLALRSVVDGVDFSQGKLQLRLTGQHIEIQDLSFRGAGGASGGELQASGSADWTPQAPTMPGTAAALAGLRMALDVQARALRVSARADQRLLVSGQLRADLRERLLSLRGALVADEALFILPDDDAPRLGADVQVRQRQPVAAEPAPAPLVSAVGLDVLVTLDPGPKFQVQGHGLDTRLVGQLTLRNEGHAVAPRLSGTLQTVSGSYRAYGQALDIDAGTLRFSGPYDNPALDVLALRPNLQQKVGVQVSGTAQAPVLRLWSDPDLPDADKLSWLVLGRSGAAGGAESAMLQQAALALWSGKGHGGAAPWTAAIGLDEVSLGEVPSANPDGSSTGTTSTSVKLGKRLSRDFYVAYERTLAGTLGTFYLFYDLSRRLTLRGESGQQKAADLIYTLRFD